MRIFTLTGLLLCMCFTSFAQTDTIKLYFELGSPKLNSRASHTLDSLIYYDILVPGNKLAIVGYADYLGTEHSNERLSKARAETVHGYLITTGFGSEDIQMVQGKGEVSRPGLESLLGFREDRRVDIIPGGVVEPVRTTSPGVSPSINVSTVKKNETIKLDNMFFLPGSHMPVKASKPEMEKLYHTMKDNPTLKIQIEGHICCLLNGTTDGYDIDAEDFNLSRNRAKHIYMYLLSRGISADRLKYAGFGKTRPLVSPEKTEEDENKNRRVEIRILEK